MRGVGLYVMCERRGAWGAGVGGCVRGKLAVGGRLARAVSPGRGRAAARLPRAAPRSARAGAACAVGPAANCAPMHACRSRASRGLPARDPRTRASGTHPLPVHTLSRSPRLRAAPTWRATSERKAPRLITSVERLRSRRGSLRGSSAAATRATRPRARPPSPPPLALPRGECTAEPILASLLRTARMTRPGAASPAAPSSGGASSSGASTGAARSAAPLGAALPNSGAPVSRDAVAMAACNQTPRACLASSSGGGWTRSTIARSQRVGPGLSPN